MRTYIDIVLEAEEQLLTKKIRQKVRRWANMAQREIGGKFFWTWLECEWTAPATIDKPNIYDLPPEFNQPLGVRFKGIDGGVGVLRVVPTEQEDAQNPNQTVVSGATPIRAMFTGRTVQLNPPPETVGGSVILRGYQTPPEMVADSDIPIIPEVHRDVLVAGIVKIGSRWLWNDKGDQDRAAADFNAGIFSMIQHEKGNTAHTESMGLDSNMADMLSGMGTV